MGRKIARGGFEFGSRLPICFHRPMGLSECAYEPSASARLAESSGTPDWAFKVEALNSALPRYILKRVIVCL